MDIETSDVIAIVALLATAGMWFRNHTFEKSVHKEQVQWQEQQEAQRQRERVEDRAFRAEETTANVKVSICLTTFRAMYPARPDGYGGLLDKERVADVIRISAANWGQVEVKLSESHLTLPDDTSLRLPFSYLVYPQATGGLRPSTLPPGDNVAGTLLATGVAEELLKRGFSGQIEIRGTVVDALGRKYYSEPYLFDMDREYINQ